LPDEPMLIWIRANAPHFNPDSRDQARWAAHLSGDEELLAAIPATSEPPLSTFGILCRALEDRNHPGLDLPNLVDLESSLCAFTMLRSGRSTFDVAALRRSSISSRRENPETLCYHVAARMLEVHRAPLSTYVEQPSTVIEKSIESAAQLEKLRRQLMEKDRELANRSEEFAAIQFSARRVSSILLAIALPFMLLMLLSPMTLFVMEVIDLSNALTVTALLFVVLLGVLTLALRRSFMKEVAPLWALRLISSLHWVRSGG